MNEQERNNDTLALIHLTEKLTENNNTVSGAIRLMSENIEEISKVAERIEEKADECNKMLAEHCGMWNNANPDIVRFIKKMDESGFVNFLLKVRNIWKFIFITIVGGFLLKSMDFILEFAKSIYLLIQKAAGG